MNVINEFTPVASISNTVLAAYAGMIPDGFIDLWREYGSGLVGDGLVRLVDPSTIQDVLPRVIEDPEDCVPLLTTALGDVVVFRDGYLFVVNTRLRAAHMLPVAKPDHVVRALNSPAFMVRELRADNYEPAVQRLGVPGIDECFYYAPLLSMGGSEASSELRRGELIAHLETAAGFQGRIRIGAPEGGPRVRPA